MSELPLITGKELGKIIFKIGYEYSPSSGSHMTYINKEDNHKITIPNHGSEKIRPGLLIKIIKKDLGLTKDLFLKWCNIYEKKIFLVIFYQGVLAKVIVKNTVLCRFK